MERGRPFFSRVVLILAGLLCILVPPRARAVTGHAVISSPFDSLNAQIVALRGADRYDDALLIARQLLDVRLQQGVTPAWRLADTRLLITTLETIAALPPPARRALAEADRLSEAIDTHYAHGDFDRASGEAERQAQLRRKYLSNRHPELVESLVSLAFTQWKLGNHSAAVQTATEAVSIAEEITPDHPRTGECLNVLGLAYMASGDFDNAETNYRRALGILREQTGEESLEFTMVLENLGALCGERVEWGEAVPYYKRCLAINRRLLGPDHPEVARSLHNLGSCYVGQHDALRARPLLEEALEIRKRALGSDHPDVALTMHVLSDVHHICGEFDQARSLLEEALAIRTKRFHANHPQIAWNLYALSSLDLAAADYASAGERGERALAIWATSNEPMQYARGLWHMGTLAWMHEDLVAVEAYDRRVREILADCNCGEYSRVLQRSAAVRAQEGRHAQAESLLVRASSVFENLRRTSATVERRGWSRVANPYRLLAAEKLWLGKTAEAWPALERWLARGLIDQLAVLEGATDGWVYELEQIQASLGREDAIMGWLDIEGVPGPAAWGYVIRNHGPVHWVELACEQAEPIHPAREGERYRAYAISEHAESLRSGLRFAAAWPSRVANSDRLDSRARKLWRERVEPLEPYLKDVRRLAVIPSRVMMGVPLETLIDHSGSRLIDRFSVSYIPSGTVYRWLNDRRHARGERRIDTALLVGDPAFSSGALAAAEDVGSEEPTHLAAHDANGGATIEVTLLRSALAGNPDALRALPALEQSQREVETIAALVGDAQVLVGAAASERNLRRFVSEGRLADFDLLHFATHAIVDQRVPETSALVLSQLDRSEWGSSFEGDEAAEDGLLDVREIVREWRLDAVLVTLSGCRTALGPNPAGEGYLGFAQAFLRAGAQSVIVSLWDVDDTATSMLMMRFYENLTGHHDGGVEGTPMSKSEALREAKRWLRDYESADGSRPFVHPSYWSAFILIGDPL